MQQTLDYQVVDVTARSRQQHTAALMLLLATVAWGFGFTWAKQAQADVNAHLGLNSESALGPMFVLAARFLLSAIVLFVVIPVARRGWNLASFARAFLLGVMLGLGMVLQHLGLARASEAVTAFLTSLTILFVPILMTFAMRRPPRAIFWIAVVIATAGVWLMTGATPSGFGVGELYGLACAIVFSAYIIVINAIVPLEGAWKMAVGMLFVSGILILIACAGHYRALADNATALLGDRNLIFSFLLLLIFPTIFSYCVMNIYQPRLDPTRAALIYLMEPIFAAVYAWIARGAALTTAALTGAALILAANALVEFLASRR